MKILRRERRIAVYKRDEGKCVWCSHVFTGVDDPLVSLDHIVPSSKQGSAWWENMLLSCKPCNGRRENLSASKFAAQQRRAGKNINASRVYRMIAEASHNPLCYKSGYRKWINSYLWAQAEGRAPKPEEIFVIPLTEA